MGTPRIGRALTTAAEELAQPALAAEMVGTVSAESLERKLKELPPPPWEVDPGHRHQDARQYVHCPADVELRWVNPRILEQVGWRHWQAVPAKGDSRFIVKNRSMIAVDNTVRRGGTGGDILAWMYKHWVESRTSLKLAAIEKQKRSAVARHSQLREELARGSYNKVRIDTAHHPTHTTADGRDMRDHG